MKKYSQRDSKWANETLGFSNSKIGDYGCFLTCLAMIDENNPYITNEKLKEEGGFYNDLIVSVDAAKTLGIPYNGVSQTKPEYGCIAEVDMSPAPGKQQHFVVVLKDTIIDPWDGGEKALSTYPIVGYRLFKFELEENEEVDIGEMDNFKEAIEESSEIMNFNYYSRFDDKDVDKYVDKIKKLKETSVVNCEEIEAELAKVKKDLEAERTYSKGLEVELDNAVKKNNELKAKLESVKKIVC